MEDGKIVELFWQRDESAITLTAEKYSGYCRAIANNILQSAEDAEECVNDTWLHAWNSIPPHRPQVLSTFLGKLTRYIALKRWRDRRADKRGGGEISLVYEELSELIPSGTDISEELEAKELATIINGAS